MEPENILQTTRTFYKKSHKLPYLNYAPTLNDACIIVKIRLIP